MKGRESLRVGEGGGLSTFFVSTKKLKKEGKTPCRNEHLVRLKKTRKKS